MSKKNKIIDEHINYANWLESILYRTIIDSGGKLNNKILNENIAAIFDIFNKKVKEHYKIDDGTLVEFFVNSDNIIPGMHSRSYFVINHEQSTIGVLWFKHILGGWRLRLFDDDDETNWQTRGVIKTKEQFEVLLINHKQKVK